MRSVTNADVVLQMYCVTMLHCCALMFFPSCFEDTCESINIIMMSMLQPDETPSPLPSVCVCNTFGLPFRPPLSQSLMLI